MSGWIAFHLQLLGQTLYCCTTPVLLFSQGTRCECFSWIRAGGKYIVFCLSGLLSPHFLSFFYALSLPRTVCVKSGLVFLSVWRGLAALSIPAGPIHPFWPPVTPPSTIVGLISSEPPVKVLQIWFSFYHESLISVGKPAAHLEIQSQIWWTNKNATFSSVPCFSLDKPISKLLKEKLFMAFHLVLTSFLCHLPSTSWGNF